MASLASSIKPAIGLFAAFAAAAKVTETDAVLSAVFPGVWTKAAATPPDKSTSVAWKNETKPINCDSVIFIVVAPVDEPEAFAPKIVTRILAVVLTDDAIRVQVKELPVIEVGKDGAAPALFCPTKATINPDVGGVQEPVTRLEPLPVVSGVADDPKLVNAIAIYL